MADARSDYQAAVQAYDAAQEVASKKIKMIANVSSALSYQLQSFMGWQYGVSIQRTQYDQKAKFEMDEWPDANALKSTLTDWHTAFVSLHHTWGAMNNSERIGFTVPPEKMSPK